MFINKARDGRHNVSGGRIAEARKQMCPPLSQRALADALQRQGLDVDKNAVQRMESRSRFITELELAVIARVLGVGMDRLIDPELLPRAE